MRELCLALGEVAGMPFATFEGMHSTITGCLM